MFVHFQLTGCLFIMNINFLHSKMQKNDLSAHKQKVSTARLENGTDGVCAILQLCTRANIRNIRFTKKSIGWARLPNNNFLTVGGRININ